MGTCCAIKAMESRFGKFALVTALACGLVPAAGCAPPRPRRVIGNPDPLGSIPAMKGAVEQKDRNSARALVKELNNDDPAVRFYAIGALRRLTGQDFGYRYFDEDDRRKPAVRRWEKWLSQQQ